MSDTPVVPAHEVDHHRSRFDQTSERAVAFVSGPAFFVLCLALLLTWLGVGWFRTGFTQMWWSAGAVGMAGVTLLLVAMLENEQRRNIQALQRKLNAIGRGVLAHTTDPEVAEELDAAIGVERWESTD